MNPVTEGQTLYRWRFGELEEFVVEKVTPKQIKARGKFGYLSTMSRYEGFPSGAVAVGSSGALLWTTAEECALTEVQRLNREISERQEKVAAITARHLGGAS